MSIQLQILTSLRRVHPRLMPVETLWAEVRMASVPQPSRSEFNQALRVLEDDKKQILVINGEDLQRAKITDDGIARHEEANS